MGEYEVMIKLTCKLENGKEAIFYGENVVEYLNKHTNSNIKADFISVEVMDV